MAGSKAWLFGATLLAGAGVGVLAGLTRKRRQFRIVGRTVLITGGSRGLGLVLAREFAREGARIALLARNVEELRRAEADLSAMGAPVFGVPCDLRKVEEVNQAVRRIEERFGGVDILVNNAGIIQVGPMEHMSVADFEEALAVHLFGPLYTTLAVLPHMRSVKRGRIVNISSIGGKIALPHLLPYTASKFALCGFSDGLRAELRKDNIFVTTVFPGLMRTGSPVNASFKGKHREEFAWFAVSDSLPLISMNARTAARRILKACRNGSSRAVLGTQTKAAVLFNELFPGVTSELMALANQWLPKPKAGVGAKTHPGWASQSKWAPSILTRLSDRAATVNNETK